MKRTMKNLLSILLLSLSIPCLAQQFSKQQLSEDANALIKGIETFNPALATYSPDFKKEAETIMKTIPEQASIVDCFRLFNRIGTLQHEGHFKVESKQVFAGILDNTYHYLPLEARIIDNKIYVWRTFTPKKSLTQGDEIMAINGRSAEEIIAILYQHIPTDGNIRSYARLKASAGFFWMYYFFIEQPNSFDITYREVNREETKKIVLPALNRKTQIDNLRNQPDYVKPEPKKASISDFYELDIQDKYAYLKLKSFDFRLVEKYKIDAKKFYHEIFEKLKEKNTKNLIVDVRNNTGGRKQFPNNIPPFIIKSESNSFIRKSVSWKGKEAIVKLPKKSKVAFQGKIYGLVNGLTFSSGATFARHLKEYGNATIIGEETGSRYEGFAAGSSQEIILPNTGMKVFIPRYHIIFPTSQNQTMDQRGLIPDIIQINTIADEISGTDTVLEKVIELVNQQE